MQILVISDIHANYPALEAIDAFFKSITFDIIINCGDSLVYAPFPNETISWLKQKKAISILGNTDKKVIKLLNGKTFKKPSKQEKRRMYTWTADNLTKESVKYLHILKKMESIPLEYTDTDTPRGEIKLGIYHGSPAKNHEFLFNTTPNRRFTELASDCVENIVLCGHSHDPFHKFLGDTHFINPGSVGRMFDGNPDASCAVLRISSTGINVQHYRITYDVSKTIKALHNAALPEIYCEMYRLGRKTN